MILLLSIGFIFYSGKAGGETTLAQNQNQDLNKVISISSLVRQFDQYDGKQVRIEGLYSDTIEGHDDLSAVFRYFVSCCTIDAQPVGVFMSRSPDAGFKNNDWVRISGRVKKTRMDGYEVIFMELDKMEAAVKPGKDAAYIRD